MAHETTSTDVIGSLHSNMAAGSQTAFEPFQQPALTSSVLLCGQSHFLLQEHTDLPGYDVSNVQAYSTHQCCVLCEIDDNCRAFSYIRRQMQCWMKYKNVEDALKRPALGIVTGYKLSQRNNY